MAQIFQPSTNTLSKFSLLSLIVLPGLLIVLLSSITRSSYNTKAGVPLDQPIPFSHAHHAEELGIDCRYCHSSVEKSGFAGIPPTHTCMSCHSQIWTNSPMLEPLRQSYATDTPVRWNRVNRLPDFVYFNHSVHVAKGVNCNVCHGPVNTMQITHKGKPFFMAWCLECHADPGKFIRDKEKVFEVYMKAQKSHLTDHGPADTKDKLTDSERTLLYDKDYAPSADDQKNGAALVEKYHINVKQLQDCWICHR
jgi:hypothetical protein